MKKYDLFIFAAEDSADLHGYNLITEIKKTSNLNILSVAGPRMRKHDIDVFLKMENFHVMGFIDIIFSLHKIVKLFFKLRKKILKENPKVLVFIDYPDFTLRLERSLRKKGFKNKIVHYVAPTVWAWRKKRALILSKNVDTLLTIFPFEKKYFSHTSLDVKYIGHPLYEISQNIQPTKRDYIGIFPGSRKNEIIRNLPFQLYTMKKLLELNKDLKFGISNSNPSLIQKILTEQKIKLKNLKLFNFEENYHFMKKMKFALATSGTINLELALHNVPTIVNFAIKPLDLFIGKYLLKINLPFYCIVNILLQKEVFYELYGPKLTKENLYNLSKKMLLDNRLYKKALDGCEKVKNILSSNDANKEAAKIILSKI